MSSARPHQSAGPGYRRRRLPRIRRAAVSPAPRLWPALQRLCAPALLAMRFREVRGFSYRGKLCPNCLSRRSADTAACLVVHGRQTMRLRGRVVLRFSTAAAGASARHRRRPATREPLLDSPRSRRHGRWFQPQAEGGQHLLPAPLHRCPDRLRPGSPASLPQCPRLSQRPRLHLLLLRCCGGEGARGGTRQPAPQRLPFLADHCSARRVRRGLHDQRALPAPP